MGIQAYSGHQCWRGTSEWAITSTGTREPNEQQLIEGRAVPHTGHVGSASPGGVRNHLSRSYPSPHFYHFATDIAGRRLVTDANLHVDGGQICVCALGTPGQDAASSWTCIAQAHGSGGEDVHLHPFLSPDGKTAFFNSDESGVLHAYMIRGPDALGLG